MIVLATPTRADITAGTAGDIVRICRRHPDVKFMAALGIYINNLRQYCVKSSQAMGASHVLFIDSDMRFPEDTLDRLLAHGKDIVGVNYVQRQPPHWWCARLDRIPLSSVGRKGLEAIDGIGFGVILIKLSVFDTLERPWFDTPYDGQNHVGEDLFFGKLVRDAGGTVYVDHDLSQDVRHQGTIEHGIESHHIMAVA